MHNERPNMSERASPEIQRVLRDAVLDQVGNNETPETLQLSLRR